MKTEPKTRTAFSMRPILSSTRSRWAASVVLILVVSCVFFAFFVEGESNHAFDKASSRISGVDPRQLGKAHLQSDVIEEAVSTHESAEVDRSLQDKTSYIKTLRGSEGRPLDSVPSTPSLQPQPTPKPAAQVSSRSKTSVRSQPVRQVTRAEPDPMTLKIEKIQADRAVSRELFLKNFMKSVPEVQDKTFTGFTMPSPDNAADAAQVSRAKREASKEPVDLAPVVLPGEAYYGVLQNNINSDYKSPVIVKLVSGPLKGGTLNGEFMLDPHTDKVRLTFQQLVFEKQVWPVNAIGVDDETYLAAVADDADHHYLERYGTLFTASFLKGIGDYLKYSGQTLITNNSETITDTGNLSAGGIALVGLGEVGDSLQDDLKQNLNRPVTVTVQAGRGLGILFLEPVLIDATLIHQKPEVLYYGKTYATPS